MRNLFLKDVWAKRGAKFGRLNASECVAEVDGFQKESAALRKTAVLSDCSHIGIFSYSENEGMEFLDTVLAANILKLRYGRMLDTYLALPDGTLAAECLAADIDDKLLLFCESTAQPAELETLLKNDGAGFENLSDGYSLLSVDGPMAWKIPQTVLNADVLNLPYLSVEKCAFDGTEVLLLRGGKIGEFGYQMLVENSAAEKLFAALETATRNVGGVLGGVESNFNARLEGGFLNPYAEGATVKCPLELGLQWMTDFDKDSFSGSERILKKRAAGVAQKLICLKALDAGTRFNIGDEIFDGENLAGKIVAVAHSAALGCGLALALMPLNYALAGFDFSVGKNSTRNCRTISRPAITTLSLKNGMAQA